MGHPGRMLAVARRRGITRGLFGTSTGWLVAGLVVWGLRGLRRALWPTVPGAQSSLRMRPGESLVITQGPRRRRPRQRA